MTEDQWLFPTTDVHAMLAFVRSKASDRKLRLYACAWIRAGWSWVTDEGSRQAVAIVEWDADGFVATSDLEAAHEAARKGAERLYAALYQAPDTIETIDRYYAGVSVQRLFDPEPLDSAANAVWLAASTEQDRSGAAAQLLRHIIGNPFRPYPASPSWPSTVVQLAESLYAGQDCAFALHDALLEAGHAELAEHFREEKSHPKGCWAMDVILGKT
jgi:hypothetical protein